MARFLLTTFGSLGDLHPYIGVGIGLRARGHEVTIATSAAYQAKVEGAGLYFHRVRPDISVPAQTPGEMAKAFHPRTGSEYVIRRMMLPYVEQSYEDLKGIAEESDLIVGHPLAFATPIVAEQLGEALDLGCFATVDDAFGVRSALGIRIPLPRMVSRFRTRVLEAILETE